MSVAGGTRPPRARPHPHAVLRHPLQIRQSGMQAGGEALGRQTLQDLRVRHPEVRERVVVHAHPATQPAEAQELPTQPRQHARAPHLLQGRVQPQRHQQARITRRMTGPTLDRLDRPVQLRQIELLDKRPHQTRPVVRRQQFIEREPVHRDLIANRNANPRQPAPHGLRYDLLDQRLKQLRSALRHHHITSS